MDALTQITLPEDPAEALAGVVALRRLADRLEAEAVDRAIALGWSWQQVADALDITRQGAHKRHAARRRAAGLHGEGS